MYKILANTIFLGKDILFLPECHSTNDKALELVKNRQAHEGSIVVTAHQTKGKGQRGNAWYSKKNENLTFSLILRPKFLDISEQFFLNMMVSNSIRETLGEYLPDLKVKWPNDLLVNGVGKLCGILIENVVTNEGWDYAVVGIGINVNQTEDLPDSATSIKACTGFHFDLEELFKLIVTQIEQGYISLKKSGKEKILTKYLNHLYGYQEWKNFEREGRVFEGMITGVNSDGKLKLRLKGEEETIFDFKELSFLL